MGRAVRANKPTEKVEMRGIEGVEEREQGMETQGRVGCGFKKNLNLSLRGSDEIQSQHWLDRLHVQPRTRSFWTVQAGSQIGRIGA